MSRKPYPSDVTDDEWAFVAPDLTLMTADAPQRDYDLREVFNGLRWIVRTGAQWRMMPNDLPPWYSVYQPAQRWIAAGVFEDMVHDLRALLRLAKGKQEQPSAAIFDGRTVQSTPESGERAAYDGYKRKKGSKIHSAVDTLGLLLAVQVTPANEQERAQVKQLAEDVQEATQNSVDVAFVDQGYTGDEPEQEAKEAGIDLIVVKLPEAQKGFVLLPRRWVVERSFAWTARFRRLARDFERTPEILRGLHFLAFAILMLHNFVKTIAHVL
jgi:transposase